MFDIIVVFIQMMYNTPTYVSRNLILLPFDSRSCINVQFESVQLTQYYVLRFREYYIGTLLLDELHTTDGRRRNE